MEPVDPLGRVQGKLSSAAGSRLFSRVKVSDARGLSSLAEPCITNINNVSDAADVSLSKFQDTSWHTSFLQLLAELHNITHLSVNAKALSENPHHFPLSFTGQKNIWWSVRSSEMVFSQTLQSVLWLIYSNMTCWRFSKHLVSYFWILCY